MTQTTNRSLKTLILSASVAALSLGAVAPVAAQTATQAPEAQQQIELTEPKLEAFVTALLGVEEVRKTYTPQIEAATDEDAQAELVTQANSEIIAKIEEVPDLTVEEYVSIAQVAQQDQALGERIATMIETRMQ